MQNGVTRYGAAALTVNATVGVCGEWEDAKRGVPGLAGMAFGLRDGRLRTCFRAHDPAPTTSNSSFFSP